MLISRLLGAPLVWSSRGIALPHSTPVRCSPAVKMSGGSADAVQSYAGIFAESTGITKAWSLPGQGCETLLVQRTARNIEGENQHSARGGVLGYCLLSVSCLNAMHMIVSIQPGSCVLRTVSPAGAVV